MPASLKSSEAGRFLRRKRRSVPGVITGLGDKLCLRGCRKDSHDPGCWGRHWPISGRGRDTLIASFGTGESGRPMAPLQGPPAYLQRASGPPHPPSPMASPPVVAEVGRGLPVYIHVWEGKQSREDYRATCACLNKYVYNVRFATQPYVYTGLQRGPPLVLLTRCERRREKRWLSPRIFISELRRRASDFGASG
ncbi:hypothetical protein EYF80_027874 [Liparis tanakae]|uniref:Uncharacterized protein n=1 Tax=Liparis tanakae TaxID=230148 RepID=A0A4Z2H7F0_9TELE|nr:hypothetical protein EYF80_027874 [Liparis tanakae]